ncbi:MAG TPA: hypothetical protein VN456_03295 [Desulfosporosinus sp.]|nr:hypothetical protein [Desulfosporosinus sp.]
MGYLSGSTKSNPLLAPASISLFQRLSLRSVKGIAVGLLLAICLEFLLLWQPAYHQLRSLQKENIYWQQVLKLGAGDDQITPMPTMDQLPDIIEQCRGAFAKEGVDVVSLNVERFGERREIGDVARLDYSLVRLHLQGNWEGIVISLKALEETTQDISIYVQEAMLDADGGTILLQIYFINL